ncbi:MAG TPA: amidohydrolase [Deltaproteobacteria bacterium]|jgi:N-acyl-D-aspartate/D-glutamate deacylase|nr:amidohydrolase [Deltaproteobacteria bacterium]
MHELVIRGGVVVDGTGTPAREGDVAIDAGRVAAVGRNLARGRRELDARGFLVTPGWVDVHTHYDGQVTWDPYLTPSGWHGVTTVVMGNCGVGFAPAKPERHEWLIGLMEGVEDIPGTALAEGIRWEWESFPEYLAALERMPRALDVAAQVPHGAVRAYVMGERGAKNEKATPEDVAAMAQIVREAIAAGAVGFSTSRTLLHRAVDGEPVPGTFAGDEEVLGIGRVLGELGRGVFELASDLAPEARELAWMHRLSRETGRPVTFACLQNDFDPGQWRRLLAEASRSAAQGGRMTPQVAARPTGLLLGLESTAHPFLLHPAYREVAHLPRVERVRALREPERRRRLVEEPSPQPNALAAFVSSAFHRLFPLGDPPDYEPAPEQSVAAMAKREGRLPQEVALDLLLSREGRELLYFPLLNYASGDFEPIREMLTHPTAVVGLSDGGAHCGLICDASMPSFLLTHWARDRRRGARLPLEQVVHAQTRRTAQLFDFQDRGALLPGMKADLNVIDFERLRIHPPQMVFDLPGAGRRLIQKVDGYRATVCNGELTFEDGRATGALPGKLVRGAMPAPAP